MQSFIFRLPAFGQACRPVFAGLTLGVLVAGAQAQSVSDKAPPRPAPALPDLSYSSVFTNYQGFADQPVSPWAQVNNTVEKIGGWRNYAKEARQPDAADGSSAAPAKAMSHREPGGKP